MEIRNMNNRVLQFTLFAFWPVIACLLLFCIGIMLAACWLMIPFGVPRREGGEWTLDFPWSKK